RVFLRVGFFRFLFGGHSWRQNELNFPKPAIAACATGGNPETRKVGEFVVSEGAGFFPRWSYPPRETVFVSTCPCGTAFTHTVGGIAHDDRPVEAVAVDVNR